MKRNGCALNCALNCALIEQSALEHLREHPAATQVETAAAIEKSRRAVQAAMASLQETGLLERKGAKRNGHWALGYQVTRLIKRRTRR
jgi:predicted transcriptional regulator